MTFAPAGEKLNHATQTHAASQTHAATQTHAAANQGRARGYAMTPGRIVAVPIPARGLKENYLGGDSAAAPAEKDQTASGRPSSFPLAPRPIVILSASMGAGHHGVSRELANRLEARGCPSVVLDVLDELPLRLGHLLPPLYLAMLRRAPCAYEGICRGWFSTDAGGIPVSPVTVLLQRALRRRLACLNPAAVVSTFHMASQALGQLRDSHELQAPTASIILDQAVHRMWVHPGVDLHLVLHPDAIEDAVRYGARRVAACGPIVSPRFFGAVEKREAARRRLGMVPSDRAVLVVAGSWGVGNLEAVVDDLANACQLHLVVVCARDERLRRRLEARSQPRLHALGWVEDMAGLMAGMDAVVENAGGLTCMEAMAVGLPVVSYRPIPGHGRANDEWMAATGLTAMAGGPAHLRAILDVLTRPGAERRSLVGTARASFVGDAGEIIAELADRSRQLRGGRGRQRLRFQRAGTRPARQGAGTRSSGTKPPRRRPISTPGYAHTAHRWSPSRAGGDGYDQAQWPAAEGGSPGRNR